MIIISICVCVFLIIALVAFVIFEKIDRQNDDPNLGPDDVCDPETLYKGLFKF
jgi:hypothetical protein